MNPRHVRTLARRAELCAPPASLTLAPIAFWAQSRCIIIMPTGKPGPQAYGNAQFVDVDLPPRFGDSPYFTSHDEPGRKRFTTRDLNHEKGDFHVSGDVQPLSMDVSHSLGFEMTRFVRGLDVTTGLTFVRNFNRDYAVDASNINAIVGVRYNMR